MGFGPSDEFFRPRRRWVFVLPVWSLDHVWFYSLGLFSCSLTLWRYPGRRPVLVERPQQIPLQICHPFPGLVHTHLRLGALLWFEPQFLRILLGVPGHIPRGRSRPPQGRILRFKIGSVLFGIDLKWSNNMCLDYHNEVKTALKSKNFIHLTKKSFEFFRIWTRSPLDLKLLTLPLDHEAIFELFNLFQKCHLKFKNVNFLMIFGCRKN